MESTKRMKRGTRVQITTTISPTYKDYLVNKHIKASTALARGVRAFMEAEEAPENPEELKESVKKLQRLVTRISEEKEQLVSEVEKLKRGIEESR